MRLGFQALILASEDRKHRCYFAPPRVPALETAGKKIPQLWLSVGSLLNRE